MTGTLVTNCNNCGLLIILSFYDFHRYRIDFPYGIPVGGFLLISSNTGTGILPYCGGSPNSGTDSLLPCGWNFVPNTEAVAGLVFSGADAVPGLVSPGA
jgi:hypothetical protein